MTFSQKLAAWYAEWGRELPWRGIDNPYFIWVSEIILQQTRIEQGRDYYHRFIAAFPTVQALAAADEQQILRLWQGLGYYSRARNMHQAAQYIVQHYHGQFPSTHDALLSLKGVGRYTAAAIASFAYRLPHPVIDGNVYRFASRLWGIATPIATSAAYTEFESLLARVIDRQRPDLFNAAMMDFGALQCRPQPDCTLCPFADDCVAYRTGRISLLPVKAAKTAPVDRWFYYLDIRVGEWLLMQQRTSRDIWRNLWELPLVETPSRLSETDACRAACDYAAQMLGFPPLSFSLAATYTHQLTHRTIHAAFLRAEAPSIPLQSLKTIEQVPLSAVAERPVPRLIDKYLRSL